MHSPVMTTQERAIRGLHDHVMRQVQQLALDRDAPIVDLGCGSGAMLRRLKAAGFSNLAGLDIAPPAPEPGITYHAVDLDGGRLPLPDGEVSLLVAVEIIEHMENLGSLLSEIRRVLAPGGRALVTTPNVHSAEARVRMFLLGSLKQFDTLGDPTHVAPIFLFPFRRLAGRHGLSIARYWGFPDDGSSPTSRPALRRLAWAAKVLGVRGDPHGDQLCMLLEPGEHAFSDTVAGKARALTAHY